MSSDNKCDTKRILQDEELGRKKYVDNAAPIKQIAKEFSLREKHSKAYKFYNQLVVPRHNLNSEIYHYVIPGHPIQYFKDNWDGSINSKFFEPFTYRSTMPKVITKMRNKEKTDPVTGYMKIKSDWQHNSIQMKKITLRCPSAKFEHLTDEVVQCPKVLIDMAECLERDPDPHFDADFNWYYSGCGNMHLICINWVDYLLHSECDSVYLSRFNKDGEMNIEPDFSASFCCEKENNILETACSSQNIVALRTKNIIHILKIVEIDDKIQFEELKQFESDFPFTSIYFDSYHTNILYTTTLNCKLTIINMDRMVGKNVKLKHHRESLVNNWNMVIGVERASYMHVEKNFITTYDKRTNKSTMSWSGQRDVVDMVLCNDITAVKPCAGSPSLYFATDHHLFLMDRRAIKNSGFKLMQRWMHGLSTAPTYIAISKAESNKEFVVVTSQWCQDTCVISNYTDSVENCCQSGGLSMPYHPPSVIDVLREARLKMLCLDIHIPVEERIATSTTGLVVMEQNENCSILTQNALGDIFQRTLYPQYMETFIEDNSVTLLNEWSKSYIVKCTDFEVTKIVNIADIWQQLKRVPDNYNFGQIVTKDYYDESEIYQAFDNEELNPELLDLWLEDRNDTITESEQSSLKLNLHFEDSESD